MTSVPDQGNFALVAYVPEPLASFLYEMRRSFTGVPCPQPHITVLPPRPLRVSKELACQSVKGIIELQSQIEVELSRVCCFADTNTLYLDIGDGATEIHRLHEFLNSGELHHQEEFDFRPHLTIVGPVDPRHLTAIFHQAEKEWKAASFPNRFVLSEFACLHQTPGGDWQRLWSAQLDDIAPKPLTALANLGRNAE